jgi:hypothetical protein
VHERRQVLQLLEGVPRKQGEPLLRPLLAEADLALAAGAARLLAQAGDASMRGWLVLASHRAGPELRAPFERELEALGVGDEERRAVLTRAGLR